MDNSQKFLKMLSDFIEAGILTSQDLKKELLSSIKFKKESLAYNLDLVTREEFIILKKLIEKQQKEIHNLKKNKLRKFKKGKRSKLTNLYNDFLIRICFLRVILLCLELQTSPDLPRTCSSLYFCQFCKMV